MTAQDEVVEQIKARLENKLNPPAVGYMEAEHDFIAHAPSDICTLLDRLFAQEVENRRLRCLSRLRLRDSPQAGEKRAK